MKRHLLSMNDCDKQDILTILDTAESMHDVQRREVTLDKRDIHLTPIEYRLLVLLAQNAGRVLTQRQILEQVWGRGSAGQAHYVRVYMAQLRRKIERDSARPRFLVTEPGVGYRLRDRLSG